MHSPGSVNVYKIKVFNLIDSKNVLKNTVIILTDEQILAIYFFNRMLECYLNNSFVDRCNTAIKKWHLDLVIR